MLPGIIVLIIVLLINICLFAHANSKSKVYIDNLRNANENAETQIHVLNSQIQIAQHELQRLLDEDVADTGVFASDIQRALKDIATSSTAIQALRQELRASIEDARYQVNKQRNVHNIFLRGASDISSLAYYKRENDMLKQIRESGSTNLDVSMNSYLIGKAQDYLRRHTS